MAGNWREKEFAAKLAKAMQLENLDNVGEERILLAFLQIDNPAGITDFAELFGITQLDYLRYLTYLRLTHGGGKWKKLETYARSIDWKEVVKEVLYGERVGHTSLEKMVKMQTLGENLFSGKKGK